jgi:hypothetical protein
MFFVVRRWAQPQRDVCWLHRLLNNCNELFAQLIQVYFHAQCRTESCQGVSSIIMTSMIAIERDTEAMKCLRCTCR